ncbi:phospholipase A2 group XII isoform X2 [Tachypleus tridentatus]
MVYLKHNCLIFKIIGVKFVILFLVSFCIYSAYAQSIMDHVKNIFSKFHDGVSKCVKEVVNGLRTVEEILDVIDTATEEECNFFCPRGQQAIGNPYFSNHPNGCGTYGFQLEDNSLFSKDMEHCCNYHDVCYGTCLADKDVCDLKFKKCLYNTCDSRTKFLQAGGLKGCKGTAKLLYLATVGLGCKAYLDSQKKA